MNLRVPGQPSRRIKPFGTERTHMRRILRVRVLDVILEPWFREFFL